MTSAKVSKASYVHIAKKKNKKKQTTGLPEKMPLRAGLELSARHLPSTGETLDSVTSTTVGVGRGRGVMQKPNLDS